jgi:hypothetical protein
VGYVGVDAHALRYPLLGGLLHVKVFHYRVQFRSLLVHLQLPDPLPRGDFEKAEAAILRALRHGRHYGANHRAGDPSGFLFYAVEGERCLLPIETAAPGPEREFIARTPLEAEIVLRRDGREVVRVQGRELRHRSSGEGVWRVEAYRKRRGWIFSNPIRILPQQKSSSAR